MALITQSMRTIGTTSVKVDKLGFGTATLGNLYHKMTDNSAREAIHYALQSGIHHFDTAPFYGFGLSERRLGDALRATSPEHYVLSTKVGRLLRPCHSAKDKLGFCSPMPFEPVYDYSYDGVMRSFEHSLQRLGLSKIDIIYMHDIGEVTHGKQHPEQFKIAMDSGYKAMDELRSQGVVSAIGLGVNEYQVCEQAMEYARFDCFLLAGRYSLLEQEALQHFLPRCEKEQISIILGGPYNSGILATGVKNNKAPPHYNYAPAPPAIIERVSRIEQVCADFSVPMAAAALQFPLAHPAVVSVIPGLSSAKRVALTQQYMQMTIPDGLWHTLQEQQLLSPDAPLPINSGLS